MGVKILVLSSFLLLFGGLAGILYLIYFPGSLEKNQSAYEMQKSYPRYVEKRQDFDTYSIKQLDSLSAADNFSFAKANATEHALPEL